MIDGNKIQEQLEKGIVMISFKSLNSGETKTREFTLHPSILPTKVKQDITKSDKLLCYDVEFGRWEDIQVDTIEKFLLVEGLMD
tara:strand:- start:168 stop:419 length:252 start_codon:yes stop_codon:yes gene_type:complete